MADEGPGDGDELLLAAGQAGDRPVLKALEGHHFQKLVDLLLDLVPGDAALAQGEGDVFKDVQMGEQGVALEDGVDVALVGGDVVDALAQEEHVALVRLLEAADDAQDRGLAAAGGTQQGEEFVVVDVQTDVLQHRLAAVEGLGDVFELDDLLHGMTPTDKKIVIRCARITCRTRRPISPYDPGG